MRKTSYGAAGYYFTIYQYLKAIIHLSSDHKSS